jgi:MFS family permease
MKRRSWIELVYINLFWLGTNIRNNAVGAFFLPYLVDQFVRPEVRNTALGETRTASLVIAMLAQPIMGLLSDRSTSRFGRRRPFIFAGVLFDIVLLALMALAFNFWFLLAVGLVQQLTANVSHGPLQALIPDLVPEEQRGVASAVKSIFELLPLVVVGATIGLLIGAGNFNGAVVATCAALAVTMLLTITLVRETPLKSKPDLPLAPTLVRVLGMLAGILAGAGMGIAAGGAVGGLAGLVAWPLAGGRYALNLGVAVGGCVAMAVAVVAGVWAGVRATLGQEARRRRSFTWWVVNRLMFLAAATTLLGFAPFFLMFAFNVDREQAAGMTGALVSTVGGCTLLSALPSGWLSDRFGQRRIVGLGGLLAALGTAIIVATVWLPDLSLIYLGGAILGLATGFFVTTNWALGTRLVPGDQAGHYLGISNLAGAGAGMVGAGLGGPVADYLNASTPGLGYFAIFSGYALLFLLSTVSLRGIREV